MSSSSSSSSSIIPQPLSLAYPSEADLRRDKLFLEDVRNGFLSRGITSSTMETIRSQRKSLILQIHQVLVKFVQNMIKETFKKIDDASSTSSTTGNNNDKNNDDNNGFRHHSNNSSYHPIFDHPDFITNPSICSWADVRSYGSVALDADLIDSDIDLVCIVPDFISRDDFLEYFPSYILSEELEGEELAVVRGAKVPVIRFVTRKTFGSSNNSNNNNNNDNETEVDLIFVGVSCLNPNDNTIRQTPPQDDEIIDVEKCFGSATLLGSSSSVSSSNNNNNNNTNNSSSSSSALLQTPNFIAPEYRMSINGVRTALELTQRLNPSTTPDAFSIVTSAIKNWAILRGILGNNYAFPGGVSFAVLVMRILQCYPNECCSGILIKFFTFFDIWIKSGSASGNIKVVKLTQMFNAYPHIGRIQGMPDTWSSMSNSGDVFPVLNPSFPHLNTTYSMTSSTMKSFAREIRRGAEMIGKHVKQYQSLVKEFDEEQEQEQKQEGKETNSSQKQKEKESAINASLRSIWRSLYSSSYKIWEEYSTLMIIEVAADFSNSNSNNNNNANTTGTKNSNNSINTNWSSQQDAAASSSSLENAPTFLETLAKKKGQQDTMFLEWSRFVESRLKFLLYSLDSVGEFECRPIPDCIKGSNFIEFAVNTRIPEKHRRFFVVGVKTVGEKKTAHQDEDNNNNNTTVENTTTQKANDNGSASSSSAVPSDSPNLHSCIAEFLFNISPENQQSFLYSNNNNSNESNNNNSSNTTTTTASTVGNTNKRMFDPQVHGKILLPPQVSILQLVTDNKNNSSGDGLPNIDFKSSALCKSHNDPLFLKGLLKETVAELSLVMKDDIDSSRGEDKTTRTENNNNRQHIDQEEPEEIIEVVEEVVNTKKGSSPKGRRRGRE